MKLYSETLKIISDIILRNKGNKDKVFKFFNEIEIAYEYGEFSYSKFNTILDVLNKYNGKDDLRKIILHILKKEYFFDGKKFLLNNEEEVLLDWLGTEQKHISYGVEDVKKELNLTLKVNGYEIIGSNWNYKIINIEEKAVQPHEKVKDFEHLPEFIEEGGKHLNEGRYWDCITNARTIIEITLKEICLRFNLRYNDDIIKSLNVVKEFFGMNAGNKDYPDYIKGMITAISGMVNNISQARNESSSAHAPEYIPKKHHAKFILETAVSLTNFLISIMELKLAKVNS
jgi:hypothetical protein